MSMYIITLPENKEEFALPINGKFNSLLEKLSKIC